jgi:hypothetical protein
MQWSQLKKSLEASFAKSVRGRVEVWATRYRHAHEQAGEAWITFDKHRLVSMGSWRYELEVTNARDRLLREWDAIGRPAPEGESSYEVAADEAEQSVHDQGIYALPDAYAAFNAYLNLSIDDILQSTNHLIKALGMLDQRFGKRRLRSYEASELVLVQKLFACRCECEGIRPPCPRLDGDPDRTAV